MNADTFRTMLHEQPFQPFEIVMSSGERHVVRHPEFAVVTANRVIVVDPATEQFSLLALLHVSELKSLETQRA